MPHHLTRDAYHSPRPRPRPRREQQNERASSQPLTFKHKTLAHMQLAARVPCAIAIIITSHRHHHHIVIVVALRALCLCTPHTRHTPRHASLHADAKRDVQQQPFYAPHPTTPGAKPTTHNELCLREALPQPNTNANNKRSNMSRLIVSSSPNNHMQSRLLVSILAAAFLRK